MIQWWFTLVIALAVMVVDWAIFAFVGNYVAKKLTKAAESAVLEGAENVKNSLFTLIPLMIPKVISAIREPIEVPKTDV